MAMVVQAEKLTITEQAREITQKYLLTDTHIDVPYRLHKTWDDVTTATISGDFDYPRAKQGGLNLPFMSIYTPPKLEQEGGGFLLANLLIDSVEAIVARAPEKFMLVRSVSDAKLAMQKDRIGLAMGMENGSPIEHKLENVQFFADRGISYITLAHGKSNHLSDSSYDKERKWNGLSPFGKEVVAEMNRLGIMIDVSHLSDEAFYQVLEVSKVPVIASHSSCRHFTPGWERNMSDDMIKALANKGGIIQVNFGSGFLTQKAKSWWDTMVKVRTDFLDKNDLTRDSKEYKQFYKDYRRDHPYPFADMTNLMAHFKHIIGLVGPEHVGIGSDFDGVGNSLPEGIKDVSGYPALIEALLKSNYSVNNIRSIMGDNLLRVWQQSEDYADTH
ncbi:MAG: membrane dipeptidase [Gammaproteobacteria bacterium]|nr:membrane dipeptidase [Gammaproteobacteria bacterium]